MNNTKQNILARLKSVQASTLCQHALNYQPWGSKGNVSEQEKLERFTQCLVNNHAQVVCTPSKNLTVVLRQQLEKMSVSNIALGTQGEFFESFVDASEGYSIRYFNQEIEQWKGELFNEIDVSITHSLAGIADTGALVLAPNQYEPRTLSLVPPRHIAVMKLSTLHCNFPDVIQHYHWCNGLPTNALLISGPSKTADIQQTLAYGAHGPKALIVLIVTDA